MRNEKGFTLIELLVVILIIGILLALIMPNFAMFQERARQSSVKANMHVFQTTMEAWAVDNMGTYTDDYTTDLWLSYLPGGDNNDPGNIIPGMMPTNPYSGTNYEDGTDIEYVPDMYDEGDAGIFGQIDEAYSGAANYLDISGIDGAAGEVNIGGLIPATSATGMPTQYGIWGYGSFPDDPLKTSGNADAGNRIYFALHN
jgi:prepilin-type N-terminal cleavage/methylation domain-containing protein